MFSLQNINSNNLMGWRCQLIILHMCCVLCLVARSCLTLCDPMDCSPPGSSVHGDSPGKNTGVSCYALLQKIFPTQNHACLSHASCIERWVLYQQHHLGSPHFMSHSCFSMNVFKSSCRYSGGHSAPKYSLHLQPCNNIHSCYLRPISEKGLSSCNQLSNSWYSLKSVGLLIVWDLVLFPFVWFEHCTLSALPFSPCNF